MNRKAAYLVAPAVLLLPLAAGAQPCLWEHTPAPAVGDFENKFFGIDGTSSSDLWGVGQSLYTKPGGGLEWQTLIQHFDGTTWTDAEAPNPGGTRWHDLWDVVAVAPDEAYAVGSYVPPTIGTASQPLALEWDGSSWRQLATPTYTGGGVFDGAARIDGEIWVAGTRAATAPDALFRGTLARWDGSAWRDELLPRFAMCGRQGDTPHAIDGVSSSDVWVVGSAHEGATCGGFPPTRYVAHYDGSEWRLVDAPWPSDFNVLNDVVAIASDDVWAVGYYTDFSLSIQRPFIIHWDGDRWEMVDLPPFPEGGAMTWAVTARASDDVFAAGARLDASGFASPLILHYAGSTWTEMPVEATDGSNEDFRALAALPGGDVWAGGLYVNGKASPLAARLVCDGPSCYADCDASGSLDFFDFLCFQNLFGAGDPAADCDASGELDFFDFLCFQNAFAAGCP